MDELSWFSEVPHYTETNNVNGARMGFEGEVLTWGDLTGRPNGPIP